MYNSGSGRTQVIKDSGNADHGQYYLGMDSNNPLGIHFTGFPTAPQLSEAILHVNATGLNNVMLSFNAKGFNQPNFSMPASFTGHSNTDGVAFSVDGVHWFRVRRTCRAPTSPMRTRHSPSTCPHWRPPTASCSAPTWPVKFQHYDTSLSQVTTRRLRLRRHTGRRAAVGQPAVGDGAAEHGQGHHADRLGAPTATPSPSRSPPTPRTARSAASTPTPGRSPTPPPAPTPAPTPSPSPSPTPPRT